MVRPCGAGVVVCSVCVCVALGAVAGCYDVYCVGTKLFVVSLCTCAVLVC